MYTVMHSNSGIFLLGRNNQNNDQEPVDTWLAHYLDKR